MSPPCQCAWHSVGLDPETYHTIEWGDSPLLTTDSRQAPRRNNGACLLCPAGGPKVASLSSPEFGGRESPQTRVKTFLSPRGAYAISGA